LVGEKLAIVSDKPQTTRTRILGVKNYPDAQVVFLDTPGIHRPLHRMNVRMVDAAVDTIRELDVLGLVVDASEPTGKGDTIVVDRESQKPIVVGRGGDMIKKIGTAAREELEKFFDRKVFLDLHVRVKSEWREDERVLGEIGLGGNE